MREILFRGKRSDNNEWIEGFYVFDDTDLTPHRIITNIDYSTGTFCNTQAPRVIPKTVGQYTGIKDKNGKKIFEGDIVKSLITEIDGYPKIKDSIIKDMTDYLNMCILDTAEDIEVIGNLFDNPELLGGTKNV